MQRIRSDLAAQLFLRAEARYAALPEALVEELACFRQEGDSDLAASIAFLIANLPETDLLNLEPSFYRAHSLETLENLAEMPWSSEIRDELFLVYVLMPRVSSEDIRLHRRFFFEELRERIAGQGMAEALQTANYYCLEHGDYASTNSRTVSPLAFYARAKGRCGEESCFVVSVLRSLGIPARQIYAPYWAHTDDNHAWCEAYVDGDWHYFGACEPEATLDCGWFDAAARRAKILLARNFSSLHYPGDALIESSTQTGLVNVSARYFKTSRLRVKINPAQAGISVHFYLFNYAAMSEFLCLVTDEEGEACIELADGHVLLRIEHAGQFVEHLLYVEGDSDTVVSFCDPLQLDPGLSERFWSMESQRFVAPSQKDCPIQEVSDQKRQLHQERLVAAKSELAARRAGFPQAPNSELQADVPDMGLELERSQRIYSREELLALALGNADTIAAYLDASGPLSELQRRRLLSSMDPKDLSDILPGVLEDHGEQSFSELERRREAIFAELPREARRDTETAEAFYDRYILSPRFERELIYPWRAEILAAFSEAEKSAFREDPKRIANFVDAEIGLPESEDYSVLTANPAKALRYRRANLRSRRILILAIARSLGIPAYSEAMSSQLYFYHRGVKTLFYPVAKRREKLARLELLDDLHQGRLRLMSQFSLQRVSDSGDRQYVSPSEFDDFSEGYRLNLPAGNYEISLCRRLDQGDLLIERQLLHLQSGKTLQYRMNYPQAESSEHDVAGLYDFKFRSLQGDFELSARAAFESGRHLFIFFAAEGEPYAHLAQDLERELDALKPYANSILFFAENRRDFEDPRMTAICKSLKGCSRALVRSESLKALYSYYVCESRELPFVLMLGDREDLLLKRNGYRVGQGAEIVQAFQQLELKRR
ncbi:MAG: transglutaminase-like domain-containing protein [Eubacteriales bacterium]|nr:transglutaminase-like domain-containing protein [Eubacteriales bacterium]